MNSLRKSWAARSISWLLTVALLIPMLMLGRRPAQAQAQQAITVIVADFIEYPHQNDRCSRHSGAGCRLQ